MARSEGTDDTLNWTRVLERANEINLNEPKGEGWRTMREIIAESPFGDNKTRMLVRTEVKAGRMDVYHGTQTGPKEMPVRQRWYRPKKF